MPALECALSLPCCRFKSAGVLAPGPPATGLCRASLLQWSPDGVNGWQVDRETQPFTYTVDTVGGGSVTYADRARHQVLVSSTGELTHVYGGARRDKETDFTSTLVQPVHTSESLSLPLL